MVDGGEGSSSAMQGRGLRVGVVSGAAALFLGVRFGLFGEKPVNLFGS
jgi:hypothetical protein